MNFLKTVFHSMFVRHSRKAQADPAYRSTMFTSAEEREGLQHCAKFAVLPRCGSYPRCLCGNEQLTPTQSDGAKGVLLAHPFLVAIVLGIIVGTTCIAGAFFSGHTFGQLCLESHPAQSVAFHECVKRMKDGGTP
jgi:hypothetical protein